MKTCHFEPGGCSRYTISEVPHGDHTVFILWMNNSGKAMRSVGKFTHWTYVAEKMKLNEEDAKAVSFFINSRNEGYVPMVQDLPREMKEHPKSENYIPVAEGESF